MNRAYQIAKHARSLRRWFSPAEAKRQAAKAVDAGACWWWPAPVQLSLFAEAA